MTVAWQPELIMVVKGFVYEHILLQGAHNPRKFPFILKIRELTNVTWKSHESGQETGIYGNSLR